LRSLRETLRIVHEVRRHAEDAAAGELNHALYRVGEVLAMLTRHDGRVWLR
jgi:hypothetical protein